MKIRYGITLILLCLTLTGCDFLRSFFGEKEKPAPPPAPPSPPAVVKKTPPKKDPEPGPIIMQEPEPAPAASLPWHEILGPSQAELPEPRPTLIWNRDLQLALADATVEGRPILVIVRGAQPEFEHWTEIQQKIDDPTPELSELLRQFVTVRIDEPRGMNLNILPLWKFQDPDNSWWVYLLSDTGGIYSVFGGRDYRSDYQRITISGLSSAMQRVLEHHYDPRRAAWNKEWNLDRPAPDTTMLRPQNLPAHDRWLRIAKGGAAPPSLEFYEIYDIYYHQKYIESQGGFSQKWIWPYPENIGLIMDPQDTLVVKSVNPGSVAEQAGIFPGDVLGAADRIQLFSETDLRVQLNQVMPTGGTIDLYWVSQGEVKNALLILPQNWKETDLSWRFTSLYGLHSGPIPGFLIQPLKAQERAQLKLAPNIFAGYAITKPGTAPHDRWRIESGKLILIKINHQFIPNMSPTRFLAWFRTRFKDNEPLTYTFMSTRGTKFTMSNNIRALPYAPFKKSARESLAGD